METRSIAPCGRPNGHEAICYELAQLGTSPPRIHNLVGLAARCGLNIPEQHRQLVNQLDNMGVVTRYPDGRRQIADALTEERVNSMFSDTMEFAEWIRAELD